MPGQQLPGLFPDRFPKDCQGHSLAGDFDQHLWISYCRIKLWNSVYFFAVLEEYAFFFFHLQKIFVTGIPRGIKIINVDAMWIMKI